MAKKYRSKKSREQAFTRLFYGMLAAAAVLVVVLIVATSMHSDDGLVVTADGHVHDAAGNHIGDYDELVANGTLTVTEDGHVHDADGNHIGDAADLLTEEHVHDEAEEEHAEEPAEGAAE